MSHSPEDSSYVVSSSSIDGTGLFARRAISKGERILEYVGERISKTEAVQRCSEDNRFIFTLDDQYDIDGSVEWNPARFANHCCAPNCSVECDAGHLWLIADRAIAPGEELTYDYGYDLEDYKEHLCNCRAKECLGFIVAEEFREHVRRALSIASSS